MAIGRAMGSLLLIVLGASSGSKPVLGLARPAELLLQPHCSAVPASSSAAIPAWANRSISSPVAWANVLTTRTASIPPTPIETQIMEKCGRSQGNAAKSGQTPGQRAVPVQAAGLGRARLRTLADQLWPAWLHTVRGGGRLGRSPYLDGSRTLVWPLYLRDNGPVRSCPERRNGRLRRCQRLAT